MSNKKLIRVRGGEKLPWKFYYRKCIFLNFFNLQKKKKKKKKKKKNFKFFKIL
jgi:hypothetical protein